MAARALQIVVHDYSGHPGQAQLSRALAARGHEVVHQHCPSYATGKGSLELEPGDPATLRFEAVSMDGEFRRYSPLERLRQEVGYGIRAGGAIAAHRPDVAVISNVPLLAHSLVTMRLRRRRIPMVFWHQDIYSTAIRAALVKQLSHAGRPVGWLAERAERAIARASAAIVVISPTFLDKLRSWGVDARATVVPNWAPIAELPVRPRDNAWRERTGLGHAPVVLYSGTLGLKHDPSILASIAEELGRSDPEARVVVVSQGKGREWLEAWRREYGASNLVLLDYQPYEDVPDMMAAADVLVALLEPDASRYSVPSKVLTYMCAERAILGVMPSDNSVAEILRSEQAGVVVEPKARADAAAWAIKLVEDETLRSSLGASARAYAEAHFSPERAAERFVEVFAGAGVRS
ncbi:MAG TPA: glycosyltransferase family 4 protein [Acidimicrobiales bacterium]|nr:glycosyltransferase family 4 protein [Acidimicrobiales bacterium]